MNEQLHVGSKIERNLPFRVGIITFGCAKNEVDSEKMTSRLKDAGYLVANDSYDCDAIIINTCSFIQSATEESIEGILDALDDESVKNLEIPVIVSGCMPARYGDELERELHEVKRFVPCSKEDDIVQIVDSLIKRDLDNTPQAIAKPNDRENNANKKTFGYVKISDGCDRWCSYCTIPIIRGRYHSFPIEDIFADIDHQIECGAREIVFIAQDTGRWGTDLELLDGRPQTLATLLEKSAKQYPDTWFRVMYIQPEGITDDLLDVMNSYPNICSYLDIPLQHVEEKILRAMNRRGCANGFVELVKHIEDRVDDVTLRSTFIVGFPGETDKDFESLMSFIEEGYFDYVGIFPYSREEGTKAYDLDDQVDEDTKLERFRQLRELADDISASKLKNRVDSTCKILIEGAEEDGQLYGRCQFQAPEVDGITFIDSGEIGTIIDCKIEDTLFYDAEACRI